MESSVSYTGVDCPTPERASEILARLAQTQLENIDVGTLLDPDACHRLVQRPH